jgi:hypothetical protein
MNDINKKIIDFYINENQLKDHKYIPMFYDSPSVKHRVLSIGLNPSLTDNIIKDLDDKELTLEHFQKSNETLKISKIQEAINFQKALKYEQKKIIYFKLLEQFFENVGYPNFEESVYHYDLYQKRHTDSEVVKKEFFKNKQLLPELITHLELIISELKPEIIFVFNAFVADKIKETKFLNNPKELDTELGCYFHKDIPVILANQLSGGATSSVYRDILVWHTKRILNKKPLKQAEKQR